MFDENLALITCRQQSAFEFQHAFVSKILGERCSVSLKTKETGYLFPLYLYPEEANGQQTLDGKTERKPNLDPKIVQKIADELGLKFVPEKKEDGPHLDTFAPIDLLDYIYAVLHSPTYREKYKEFLKIDFPRVPYPKNTRTFWELVQLGGELRKIHLLEHPIVNDFITTYPVSGDNEITKKLTKTQPGFIPYTEDDTVDGAHLEGGLHLKTNEPLGKVQINNKQYFGQVPQKAWNFYIGGYQPAQKWLKDRRGRPLSFEETQHYQKIIVALMETGRLMQQIDTIELE